MAMQPKMPKIEFLICAEPVGIVAFLTPNLESLIQQGYSGDLPAGQQRRLEIVAERTSADFRAAPDLRC